jgi:hypothetical protein
VLLRFGLMVVGSVSDKTVSRDLGYLAAHFHGTVVVREVDYTPESWLSDVSDLTHTTNAANDNLR